VAALDRAKPLASPARSRARGLVETGTIEATDPRASGRVISIANANQLEVDGGGLAIGAARMRLVNDGGAWAGTSQGLHIVADGGGAMEIAILTGEGGYERLTLIMVQYADDDAQTRRGVTIPSDRLPPVPEAIDLPPPSSPRLVLWSVRPSLGWSGEIRPPRPRGSRDRSSTRPTSRRRGRPRRSP
jgi:hypothetical protein